MAYEIKKGIPISKKTRTAKRKYPFDELEVGDCFDEPYFESDQKDIVGNRISNAIMNYAPKKFTRRTIKEEYVIRVWRIE